MGFGGSRLVAQVSDSKAVFALLATTALIAAAAVMPARASDTSVVQVAQAGPAQTGPAQTRMRFDIPAQPLATALNAFGRQSGLLVTATSTVTAGVQTAGVSGDLTPNDALARLLNGTGLTWQYTDSRTVNLIEAPKSGAATVLPTISVQGQTPLPPQAEIGNLPDAYAGGQVARGGKLGVLGNRDVMDTPFNQISYTAAKVEDQHARILSDVLIDHPSVQSLAPRSGSNIDLFTIRGFLSQSVLYGGLPGMMGTDSAMPELAERIEVLTGPSAMLNGNLGMAGSLNIIPKRAPDEDLLRFTPTYGATGNYGGHVDMGHRFGKEKEFGVRFNGVYRDGETAVKDVSDERMLGALSLDYRGERLRLAADMGYQEQDLQGVIPRITLGAGVASVPTVPKTDRNPGVPWGYKQNEDRFAVFRGEYDITDNVTAFASLGRHDWQRIFLSNRLNITNINGTATGSTVLSNFTEHNTSGDAGLRTRFDTGFVSHELVVSGSMSQVDYGVGETAGPGFTTNIYSPAAIAEPNLALPADKIYTDTRLSSAVVADTLSMLDKRVQLTLGVRHQTVSTDNYSYNGGVPLANSEESLLSPSVALVVKPLQTVSVYANMIQGLEAGEAVTGNYTNAGTVFPPYKSKQYETGVKVDWGNWTTTASVFQLTRPSAFDDTSTTPNTRVLAGEQRNRGLELNIFGEPLEGIRLLGGAMFLDPVLTKTQGGIADGFQAPSTPDLQVRLAGEWDTPFLRGLTLTGRVLYTSEQYLDTLASRRAIPDWTRYDVGARYAFDNLKSPTGRPIVVRLNIDNVLGKEYWMAPNIMAAPRTVWLSTTFDF